MNRNQPDDRVDPLLERLLAGEIAPDDDAVQQRMQQDPDFAAEAEALLTLAAELDPIPPSARGEPEPWVGADQAMAELVRKHARPIAPAPIAQAPIAPRGRRWPWILAVAAAAAAVAAMLLWRPDQLREPDGPVQLDQRGNLPKFSGTRSELARHVFDWSELTSARTATYRIQFVDDQRRPLAGIAAVELRTKRYRPAAELVAGLPRQSWLQITESTGFSPPKPWIAKVTLLD